MLRCPYFDGDIARLDDSAARAVPGVRAVVVVPGPKPGEPFTANLATGVAVVADDMWSALKGRNALKVEWTRGPFASESSAALDAQCAELLAKRGQVVHDDGDFDAAAPRRRAGRQGAVPHPVREPFAARGALRVRPRAGGPGARGRGPAAAGRRLAGRARGDRHPARRDQRRDDARGRRLRPAPDQRLRRRGGARLQGDRLAGQARVDALGRPAARLLPAVRAPRARRRRSAPTGASRAGRIASRARRSTTGART